MFFLDVLGCHTFGNGDDFLAVCESGDPVGTGAAAADFVGTWGELIFCTGEFHFEGDPAFFVSFDDCLLVCRVLCSDFLVLRCPPVLFEDVSFALQFDCWFVVRPAVCAPDFVDSYEFGACLAKDPRVFCLDILGNLSV